jgi:hypothetical protein
MPPAQISDYYKKAFQDFAGGLNTTNSQLTIQPNQFAQLDNFVVSKRGLLEKAEGYVLDGSPFPDDVDSFIRMIVNYRRGSTIDKLVVAALDEGNTDASYKVDLKETSGDGNYAYIGYTTGVATFTNGSANVTAGTGAFTTHLKAGDKIKPDATSAWYVVDAVTGAGTLTLGSVFAEVTQTLGAYTARILLHKDFIPRAIVFNDNLVITNGSEAPMSFNNSTLTLITDAQAPKGKYIEAHKSRIFISGLSGSPSDVWWSAVNDETSWDAAAFEPIFAKDGGNVCSIKSFADSLLVFKDNGKIYQIIGNFDQDAVGEPNQIRRVDTPENMGNIAGYTPVVGNDNKLYVLTETGIYSIDGSMRVKKESWDIKPTTDEITIRPALVSGKAYFYDTKTQWDNGTHAGTMVTSDGKLKPKHEYITRSDATKRDECISVAIDSSETIHAAYLDSANPLKITYCKVLADGTITTETATTETRTITSLSIGVSASGIVGIAWTYTSGSLVYGNALIENTSGTWGSVQVPSRYAFGYSSARSICIAYNSSNDPRIAFAGKAAGAIPCVIYSKRATGTWTDSSVYEDPANTGDTNNVSLLLTSDNPRVSFIYTTSIRVYSSANDGTTWTNTENFAADVRGRSQLQLNAAGDLITGYVDASGDDFKKRNHTTGTTTTLKTTTGTCYSAGYIVSSATTADQDYFYYVTGIGSATEHFGWASTEIVGGTSVAYSNTVGSAAMASYGRVFVTIMFGASANGVIIRKVTPISVHKTDETSDSTLTAWGNYEVTQTANGATVTHTAALSTVDQGADPLSDGSYTVVLTNNSLISTSTTKVFVSVKIDIILGLLDTAPEINSITLNYSGAGVSALMPTSVCFNNELYFAKGTPAALYNTKVLLKDRIGVFQELSYPVLFTARYKGLLYAGLANSGKVVKLRNSYGLSGVSYTGTAVLKEDLLGSIELEKNVNKVYVIYETKSIGTITFSYRLDNFKTPGGATWVDSTINQTANSDTPGFAEVLVGNKGSSIQFKVSNGTLDNEVSIVGFVVSYTYLNAR